jgi:hypothetical protein
MISKPAFSRLFYDSSGMAVGFSEDMFSLPDASPLSLFSLFSSFPAVDVKVMLKDFSVEACGSGGGLRTGLASTSGRLCWVSRLVTGERPNVLRSLERMYCPAFVGATYFLVK